MVYVELDPETDQPRKVCGFYAIHEDSFVISEWPTIEEAQQEADRLNALKGKL